MAATSISPRRVALETGALFTSVFVIAVCGLLYELIIGSQSSYLLGDSVYQFSLTLGCYLTAMGIGSYLSRFVQRRLLETFLAVELAIGLLGGFAAMALFATYAVAPRSYAVVMITTLLVIGTLVGLEIPLITRIASGYGNVRDMLANVLAFDYVGALAASLLFPLVLLPTFGLTKTSLVVGGLNVLVVGLNLRAFWDELPGRRLFVAATVASLGLLGLGFAQSTLAIALFEHRLYRDEIIYAEQSRFQRIVVTQYQDDLRLHLDNELQFSSRDEYRYHESLVHPAMSLARSREHVLIIGGGDGMALREVLKYPDVQQATLVDLDPAMTRLGLEFAPLVQLNGDALRDRRATVLNRDGYTFLAESSDLFEVIIIDLPDPRNESLARLYSREFYGLVERHLARGGVFVTQASSPYFVHAAFWCINETARAAGLFTLPYHTYIPSFGDWGFVLGSNIEVAWSDITIQVPTRYLDDELLGELVTFDADSAPVPTTVSSLENPTVWRYYLESWRRWRE